MWEIGIAKKEITTYQEGKGLFGYGMWFQKAKGALTDLHARAFVFRSNGKVFAMVCCELGMISTYLKHSVVASIQNLLPNENWSDANIMISAQHTHSGPAGFTQYPFYNILVPGFQAKIFDDLHKGIVDAIIEAYGKLEKGSIKYAFKNFDKNTKIAINRSVDAYNANPEVKPTGIFDALDKRMRLMRFEDENGNLKGSYNWFGIHTTSMPNTNNHIHFDNKGYAAAIHEEEYKENPDFVSAFAQEKCGDVTPNYLWDKELRRTRGPHKSGDKNALHTGEQQYKHASQLLKEAKKDGIQLSPQLDYGLMYVDFSDVEANPIFANGKTNAHTTSACLGASFFCGTAEGPGTQNNFESFTVKSTAWLTNRFEQVAFGLFGSKTYRTEMKGRYKNQLPKAIMMDAGRGVLNGAKHPRKMIVPDVFDPSLALVKKADREGALDKRPWIPHILPIQLVIIGNIALAGIAAEITTIAGHRLANSIKKVLVKKGVEEVILCPYSNAYNGYITTHQEYQLQKYEGGHTVFGKWTLAAYQTKFSQLANQMLKPETQRNFNPLVQPIVYNENEVWVSS